GEDGNVHLVLDNGVTEVIWPADAAIEEAGRLVFSTPYGLSVEVPAALLGPVRQAATHFALEIVPLEPEDHARLLETVGGREHIRLTGNTYSLKLGVRGEDGNWTTITAFGQPVTLVFLVDPAMDPALTHVYCVDEQ